MEIQNYKPNSHKSKEEPQKLDKIIEGTAISKKQSKIKNFLISEDATNVKSYILLEVLIPAIKKAISATGEAMSDVIKDGIDMMLYGETRARGKSSISSKISYRSYYDKEDRDRRDYKSTRQRLGYNYDDVILDNRGEAEEVLSRLDELIETYGIASVADLYDLVGISGNYTDNKYGWTDLRNAQVLRVREGYLIKLPKAIPLN